jgi:hypothetical protein
MCEAIYEQDVILVTEYAVMIMQYQVAVITHNRRLLLSWPFVLTL